MTAKNTLAPKEDEPSRTPNVPPGHIHGPELPAGLTAHRRFRARAGNGPKWRLGHRSDGTGQVSQNWPRVVPSRQAQSEGSLNSVTDAALLEMQRVAQALQLPVVVQRRRSFSGKGQLLQKREFLRSDVGAQGGSLRNSRSPGSSSIGAASSRSTNSNRFEWAFASRRFRTISMPKVARSISQDSIRGSRNVTQ